MGIILPIGRGESLLSGRFGVIGRKRFAPFVPLVTKASSHSTFVSSMETVTLMITAKTMYAIGVAKITGHS